MPATTAAPPLPLQLARYACCALRWAWLGYTIWETRHYLRDCARDGLVHSLHLHEWRANLAGMETERVALRSQLSRGLHPWLP